MKFVNLFNNKQTFSILMVKIRSQKWIIQKKILRISNINIKETTMELYDIDWNVIEKIFDDLEETFNLFNEDEEQ